MSFISIFSMYNIILCMRTWCEVRNFASKKFRLTPVWSFYTTDPVAALQTRFDNSKKKVRYCGRSRFSCFYNSGSQPFRWRE